MPCALCHVGVSYMKSLRSCSRGRHFCVFCRFSSVFWLSAHKLYLLEPPQLVPLRFYSKMNQGGLRSIQRTVVVGLALLLHCGRSFNIVPPTSASSRCRRAFPAALASTSSPSPGTITSSSAAAAAVDNNTISSSQYTLLLLCLRLV